MTFAITPGELEFQYGLALNGQTYKIFAATTGSLTLASTLTAWEAAEIATINGYAALTGTLPAGTYDATAGRYTPPIISGQFGPATGAGFQFDAMVIKIGTSRTRPYAVRLLPAPVLLIAGQTRSFEITIGTKV